MKLKLTAILTASILIASVFALATLLLPVYGATCPSPITTTTTLTADCTSSIEITADNVTLDCNQHTITGSGSSNGINLVSRSGVTVKNCNVTGFSVGIKLDASNGNTLTGNTANSNNSDGIVLFSSNGNTLTGNTANSNTLHGIFLSFSNDNTLTGNTASNNNRGIFLSVSSGNTFRDNTTEANQDGFSVVTGSDANQITGNLIAKNEHGIHICLSVMQPDNTIFPNKFRGPQQPVFTDRFC